jgi:hypothetical protein
VTRPGSWDVTGCAATWFDVDNDQGGWFDVDLIDCQLVPPPPPPPPPSPRPITRRRTRGGGGGGISRIDYCPPEWLLRWAEPQEEECETDSDYALIHITEGAVVRALSAGTIESFVDDRGRSSVVLTADDGTRYWYADIGSSLVKDGARVRANQPIARTKANAPAIPRITSPGAPKALPGHDEPPPPPAQVVFVETPVPPPPVVPLRRFRLVPLAPPPVLAAPPKEWAVSEPARTSMALRVALGVGAVAAFILALSMLGRRKTPSRPKRRQRRRPRR